MTVTFVGHSLVLLWDRVMEVVKEKIRNCISECKSVTFYLGGYGEFDKLCASACRELKREREGIDLVYVTPYFELKDQKKISELQRSGLYDSSIYPPIERVPPRFAILANKNLNRTRFKRRIFRDNSPKSLVISAYYFTFSTFLTKNPFS